MLDSHGRWSLARFSKRGKALPDICRHDIMRVGRALPALIVLLASPLVQAGKLDRAASPGSEAASLYERLANDPPGACAGFFQAVRQSSGDPWVYRGAALCGARVASQQEPFRQALGGARPDLPLTQFAWGMLHHYRGAHTEAVQMLRQVLSNAPELALAWNALGASLRAVGDLEGSVAAIEHALELSPTLDLARQNLAGSYLAKQLARERTEVWSRLRTRLSTLIERWAALSPPRITPPQMNADQVMEKAGKPELDEAVRLLSELDGLTAAQRHEHIEALLSRGALTELQIWFPMFLADGDQLSDLSLAATRLEFTLEIAEAARRRDALLRAGGQALYLVSLMPPSESLIPLIERWSRLPDEPQDSGGKALIQFVYGRVLASAGQQETALTAFRAARERYHAAGNIEGEANTRLREANLKAQMNQPVAASEGYRQAREAYRAIGDHLGEGNSWTGEGDVLFQAGRNEEALEAYRTARGLFNQVKAWRAGANTWMDESEVLFLLGRHEQALTACHEARALYQLAADDQGKGYAEWCTGRADFLMGRHEDSLKAHRAARGLLNAAGDHRGEANTWVGEGHVLAISGAFDEALHAFRNARALYETAREESGIGKALHGEAMVLFLLGHNVESLRINRDARRHFETAGDRLGEGNTWDNEADVLYRIGLYGDALNALRQARAFFVEMGDRLGEGNTWKSEGDIHLAIGHRQEALTAFRMAGACFRAVGDAVGEGNSWNGEAEVHLAANKHVEALEAFQTALEWHGKGKNPQGETLDRLGQAEALLGLGRSAEAERDVVEALDLARRVQVPDNLLMALQLYQRCLEVLGRLPEAESVAEEALEMQGQLRRAGLTDREKTHMSRTLAWTLDFLVMRYASDPERLDAAFRVAELGHASALQDQVLSGPMGLPSTGDERLIERRRALRKELGALAEQSRQSHTQEERLVAERRRRELEEVLYGIDWELMASLQQRPNLEQEAAMNATRARALASEVGPILYYYVAPRQTVIFLLRPDKPLEVVVVPVERQTLAAMVERFRYYLSNELWRAKADSSGTALWALLIEPFAKALEGADRLTIIPHGSLHELPFAALPGPDHSPLLTRWPISTAPSATVLAALRQRPRVAREEGGFVGLAAGVGLQAPGRELDAIRSIITSALGREPVLVPEATVDAYETLAPQANQLLITTRGAHMDRSWTGTYLELAHTSAYDGRLRALDIARIPLRAELVVLAACDSARGTAVSSDDRQDLTRAFWIGGASAVLSTLWKVPDNAQTLEFVKDFYITYFGGPSGRRIRKDEALREAQRRAMARGAPTQVWATWTLAGDAR